jgi:SNF2 family DNA or RNA helicase
MNQDWGVENSRICIRTEAGEILYPSARDVFTAAFSAPAPCGSGDLLPNIIESLPWISFSRFTPELALRLTGTMTAEIVLQWGMCVDGEFVRLSEGQDQVVALNKWVPVDIESITELRSWLNTHGIRHDQALSYRQVLWLKRAAKGLVTVFDSIITDPRLFDGSGSETFAIPGLCGSLYPYQIEGVRFLHAVAQQGLGCILADEMGLGKTLQLIALLQIEKNCRRTPSLVIAPATLLENWRREIGTFAPDLQVVVHAGCWRTGDPTTFAGADVVITSYDLAVRDEVLINDIPWNVLVLDEAQNIKNPATQRAIAVKRISRRVSIAVTGTPVENRLADLWSLSDFALSGLLGSQAGFENTFDDTLADADALAKLVAPITLRRNVIDVARDLPPRIDILQPVIMSERLIALYETLRKETLVEYGASGALVATTRLRLLCAHPSLTAAWDSSVPADMPKYERLFEILEEIFDCGEKVLIFTSFQAMADLLTQDLAKRWPAGLFLCVDGRVAVEKRQLLVDEFSSFIGYGSMILNPKAAGTGLNITAANHVIHYNPEWNPALTAQSTARAFRRKQTRPVTVHHLYFAGSVEDVIVSRAAFKSQLAGNVFDEHHEDTAINELNALALAVSPSAN